MYNEVSIYAKNINTYRQAVQYQSARKMHKT